jgi:RNA polymerase sigma-70 factor (family 1)
MVLHPPDDRILEDFRQGDTQALSEVYHIYFRTLCYFADKFIDNKQAAEDIVADSFIKLWEKRNDFENIQTIKSFLFVATRNACLNFLKHEKIETRSHKEIRSLAIESDDQVINEQIEAAVLHAIYEEVESLPAQCRNIFKLLFYKGMTTAEIAEHLDLSPQTVRNQKTKAIQLLRTALLRKNLPLSAVLFFLAVISRENLN